MTTYAHIEMEIVRWAESKKLIPQSSPATQLQDVYTHLEKLAAATLRQDKEDVIFSVGDVMAHLIVYCVLQDINLVECMYLAYEEIKDRKGTLLPNGVFVKE